MTKNQKNENQDNEGFFSRARDNGALVPLGIVLGFSALLYTLSLAFNPIETIQKTKAALSEIFNGTTPKTVLPDCQKELSKTVVADGKTYTISCNPK